MSSFIDDKSEHCIPFILRLLDEHQKYYKARSVDTPPFFIGLNGVQGAGKTTLVSKLCETLISSYNLPTVVLSIDDLYLPHAQQKALAASQPTNPLIQHRGEPSTHDIAIGVELFEALVERRENVKIPSYDKSKYDGAGDRRPESEWKTVNYDGKNSVDVVIFEGWCVGFRALDNADVEMKWSDATEAYKAQPDTYNGQLAKLELEHVLFVNKNLRLYDALTDRLNAFIHIDAEDTQFVYAWRLEQEAVMRKTTGTGMSEQQVHVFVDGYYPAYELYTDILRKGIFKEKHKQLRLVVGKDRQVKEIQQI